MLLSLVPSLKIRQRGKEWWMEAPEKNKKILDDVIRFLIQYGIMLQYLQNEFKK